MKLVLETAITVCSVLLMNRFKRFNGRLVVSLPFGWRSVMTGTANPEFGRGMPYPTNLDLG